MVTYRVTVNIDEGWIGRFNSNGMRLCFATAVGGGGGSNYNVVAFSDSVSENNVIEWEETYMIAASKSKFMDGAKFTTATKPAPIEAGQSFRIDDSWVRQPINLDKNAPDGGFLFRNDTVASCVVYKNVMGQPAAVYISAGGPLPPGQEALNPAPKCKVWFSSSHGTGSMVSSMQGRVKEIDLTSRPEATVKYNQAGVWENLS